MAGLAKEIEQAFTDALGIELPDGKIDELSEGIANAVVNFLLKQKFTITKMKAGLELEELSTQGPLMAKVDSTVNTTVASPIPVQVGISGTGGTVAPGTGIGTGKGMVTEALKMSKFGAKHGATLKTKGYAYLGNPADGGNQVGERNQDTSVNEVRLLDENIPAKSR